MPEKFKKDRIEELYRSGVTSPAEIARQLGTDLKYVSKVLRRKGLRGQGDTNKQEPGATQEDKEKETSQAGGGSPPSDTGGGSPPSDRGKAPSRKRR